MDKDLRLRCNLFVAVVVQPCRDLSAGLEKLVKWVKNVTRVRTKNPNLVSICDLTLKMENITLLIESNS
jgi:hypothetical protein